MPPERIVVKSHTKKKKQKKIISNANKTKTHKTVFKTYTSIFIILCNVGTI